MTTKTGKVLVKPGEIVQDSGIYKDVKSGQRATMVKGEHAPPTPEPKGIWEQVIDTNPD
jgi:hypothetical protein